RRLSRLPCGAAPGGKSLCRGQRHPRGPGHRQPERQPGAMADRGRPYAHTLPGGAGCMPGAGRTGACRARRGRPGVDRRRVGHLRCRKRDAVTLVSLIDHVVVAADTLERGVQWCEATLGVTPERGGEHSLMGTHNRLLRIATPQFPRAYLEIIAINTEASQPARRRWFDLDDPALRHQVHRQPRLVHFVASTADAAAALKALARLGIERGPLVAAERATPSGLLRWQISV